MLYNWECCSFYPNNFGASALTEKKMALHLWLNLLVSFLSSLFIR